MNLVLSPEAARQFIEIIEWTEFNFGLKQADRYADFLNLEMQQLLSSYKLTRPVPSRSELHYVVCRFKPSGFGHVIVFRVSQDEVYIIGLFHTAQDWESRLSD